MIEHVVRRGLEHASSGMDVLRRSADEGTTIEMPSWAVGLVVVLFFAFAIFLSAVEYMLKDVIASLSMIETPTAAITVSTPDEPASKDEKEGLLETAPTITLVHSKPITSSIRGTIRHLVSQGGRFARWRGFKIHALYALAFSMTTHVISTVLPRSLPFHMVFTSGLAGAVCANLHAAWTHKVVSMPSNLTFWQRVPSRSSWKVLALPAALRAAMPYLTLYVAKFFIMLFGLEGMANENFSNYSGLDWTLLLGRWAAIIVLGISCALFLCLPAIVTLIRIEASLLPEDQDTIVPFDRTFGGKVVPKILGGTGAISFLEAWRSFNWAARRRLIKLYTKIFFIVTGIVFVYAHVMAFVIFAAMGPAVGKFLSQAKQQGLIQ